jgi:hypothetical protein
VEDSLELIVIGGQQRHVRQTVPIDGDAPDLTASIALEGANSSLCVFIQARMVYRVVSTGA